MSLPTRYTLLNKSVQCATVSRAENEEVLKVEKQQESLKKWTFFGGFQTATNWANTTKTFARKVFLLNKKRAWIESAGYFKEKEVVELVLWTEVRLKQLACVAFLSSHILRIRYKMILWIRCLSVPSLNFAYSLQSCSFERIDLRCRCTDGLGRVLRWPLLTCHFSIICRQDKDAKKILFYHLCISVSFPSVSRSLKEAGERQSSETIDTLIKYVLVRCLRSYENSSQEINYLTSLLLLVLLVVSQVSIKIVGCEWSLRRENKNIDNDIGRHSKKKRRNRRLT